MKSAAQGLFHNNSTTQPLPEKLRPLTLEAMIPPSGLPKHLLEQWKDGKGTPPNLILWGPPGSGKTTLARALGRTFQASYHELSAVTVGVKEVRALMTQAQGALSPTLLFLDEVHRFNKSQQDILLPWIENGTVSFIGATTENPSYSLNAALLSRCEVIHLTGFDSDSLESILDSALSAENFSLTADEKKAFIHIASGDARSMLRALDLWMQQKSDISLEAFLAQSSKILYDRDGDQHFDSISAFIKSMRAGDADSALYYGLRMIEAGEDPRYLLRRMIVFASEDIGNAQPQALLIATEALKAFESVGLPEGKIPLSQAICFLATAPKSRASYDALRRAESFLKDNPNLEVPLHLRNKVPPGMSSEEEARLSSQSPLHDVTFYEPTGSGYEAKLRNKD